MWLASGCGWSWVGAVNSSVDISKRPLILFKRMPQTAGKRATASHTVQFEFAPVRPAWRSLGVISPGSWRCTDAELQEGSVAV
jgi:hypothetical protein